MTKLRKSAQGRECQIRLPGICNHNPETVVLCHWNGGGMGMKNPDLLAAFGCLACHDVVDLRVKSEFSNERVRMMFAEGIFRTQQIWLKEGLVKIA